MRTMMNLMEDLKSHQKKYGKILHVYRSMREIERKDRSEFFQNYFVEVENRVKEYYSIVNLFTSKINELQQKEYDNEKF